MANVLNPRNKKTPDGITYFKPVGIGDVLLEQSSSREEQYASKMHKHLVDLINDFESNLSDEMQAGGRLVSFQGLEFGIDALHLGLCLAGCCLLIKIAQYFVLQSEFSDQFGHREAGRRALSMYALPKLQHCMPLPLLRL